MKRILREQVGTLSPVHAQTGTVRLTTLLSRCVSHGQSIRSSQGPGDGRRSRWRPFGPHSLAAQSRRFKTGRGARAADRNRDGSCRRHVPDLTVAEFAVFEERQAAGGVALRRGSRTTRRCVPATSNSMRNTLPLALKAACGLVRQVGAGDRSVAHALGPQI